MQNGVAVGGLHMGPKKLLNFLELHLGMAPSGQSEIERLFSYRQQLSWQIKWVGKKY